jgi:hypothetical protein
MCLLSSSLQSFAVVGVSSPPAPPAVLVSLVVSMENPSPASFPLGAVSTLGMYVSGQRIGAAQAFNATLTPGTNTLYLNATLAPPPAAMVATSIFFSDYLNGENGTAVVVGESVDIGGGAITPPWLLQAVRNLTLAAVLPGVVGLEMLTDLKVLSLGLNFPVPGDSPSLAVNPTATGSVSSMLHLPFDIPVSIYGVDVALVFVDVASGLPMASLTAANQPGFLTPCGVDGVVCAPATATNAAEIGRLTLNLGPAPLVITDATLFGALIAETVLANASYVRLVGLATPLVGLPFGNISLYNVSIDETVALPGMNSFRSPGPLVTVSAGGLEGRW